LGAINESLQVSQEEYPLTVASGGNCRRSSPYSTRQGYFAELARGLSRASLAHQNPIKVAVVTEAGRTDEARPSGFDAPAVPVRLFAATVRGRPLQGRPITKSGQGNPHWKSQNRCTAAVLATTLSLPSHRAGGRPAEPGAACEDAWRHNAPYLTRCDRAAPARGKLAPRKGGPTALSEQMLGRLRHISLMS
jgi:hypothetical protein